MAGVQTPYGALLGLISCEISCVLWRHYNGHVYRSTETADSNEELPESVCSLRSLNTSLICSTVRSRMTRSCWNHLDHFSSLLHRMFSGIRIDPPRFAWLSEVLTLAPYCTCGAFRKVCWDFSYHWHLSFMSELYWMVGTWSRITTATSTISSCCAETCGMLHVSAALSESQAPVVVITTGKCPSAAPVVSRQFLTDLLNVSGTCDLCHHGSFATLNKALNWGLPLRRDRDFDGLVDELQLLGFRSTV